MTDLKPCPFCGNAPRYLAAKQGFYTERVICDHCNFYLPPHLWNARSALQHQEEREPVKRDYCAEKLKPGGCQLHNLHCGFPKCNEPPPLLQKEEGDGRTDADYAIEHAGYLANSARYLLGCMNELEAAKEEAESQTVEAIDDCEACAETVSEARAALRNVIYEFEKRRDRAIATRQAVPFDFGRASIKGEGGDE